MVVVSARGGRADGAARRTQQQQSELEQGVRADPLVQAVLARFPGAEIVGVRRRETIAPDDGVPPADDEPPPNPDDYGADDMTTTEVQRWLISSG